MKHKHLIALLQAGYTTIQVTFVGYAKPYTYKAPASAGIEAGDKVIVDSPTSGLTVVDVVSVDATPRIDLDADFTYKWIVQKVDMAAYQRTIDLEAEAMEMLEEAERRRQRDSLMKEYTDQFPEGTEARKLFDKTVESLASGA